jgi:muramoyltetrapeptide carboxypeptidase
MIHPPRLKKGDTIGIIAPASPFSKKRFVAGERALRDLGFGIKYDVRIFKRERYLAGMDERRADEINSMFADEEVKGIICARGGYGSIRILPMLDRKAIRVNPKAFFGFSDVTSILAYHGPMLIPNFGGGIDDSTMQTFLTVGAGRPIRYRLSSRAIKILKHGSATGIFKGGCLSIICSLLGTPYEPSFKDCILFLEDVNEPPYRIDRMLNQLKLAGKFDGVKGVIFGRMKGCEPGRRDGYTLEDVITEILSVYGIPVIYGFPSGHGTVNYSIPFGLLGMMDTSTGAVWSGGF